LNGDSITVAWSPKADDTAMVALDKKLTLFNSGPKPISIGVRKIELTPAQEDASNSFCFARFCFVPSVYESPFFEDLAAGASDAALETGFTGTFNFDVKVHHPSEDRIAYVYVFYDGNNPADSSRVIVKFNTLRAGNAVISRSAKWVPITRLKADPGKAAFRIGRIGNPAGPLSFSLTKAFGEEIELASISPDANGIRLETGKLTAGIYFLSIRSGNRLVGFEKILMSP
jgi:hypothetical protein